MTTAKELAAATQAQRLAEGYRKRFEAAAMGADNADDVVCSLARTLLRRASGSPQPEPALIQADTRDVVRGALNAALAWEDSRAAYLAEKALAALDAAPAEPETVGYNVISKNGKTLGRDAAYALAQSGDRIVRLVVEAVWP